MNNPTDYIKLMGERSEVGKVPARFTRHVDGETPKLLNTERMASIFVLQGGISCISNIGGRVKMTAPQMMIIDKFQLRGLHCVGNTVILECVESENMSPLMRSTSRALRMPCSEIVTLNNKVNKWCENMLIDLMENPVRNNDYYHGRCSNLTTLLLEYPRIVLGSLFVPFFACSTHCDTCTRQFGGDE